MRKIGLADQNHKTDKKVLTIKNRLLLRNTLVISHLLYSAGISQTEKINKVSCKNTECMAESQCSQTTRSLLKAGPLLIIVLLSFLFSRKNSLYKSDHGSYKLFTTQLTAFYQNFSGFVVFNR